MDDMTERVNNARAYRRKVRAERQRARALRARRLSWVFAILVGLLFWALVLGVLV